MKVAYVSLVDLSRQYGARTHTVEILRAFGGQGHEVQAILPGPVMDLQLGSKVNVRWVDPPKQSLRSLMRTYRQIAGELSALRLGFSPDIYYERECAFDPIVWRVARKLGIPRVIEINGLVTEELKQHGASWRGVYLARWNQRAKCRSASLLVCGAPGWVDWLEREYQLPEGRAVFIPNGVAPGVAIQHASGSSRHMLGFKEDWFVVGFAGSFNQYADLSTVIRGIVAAHSEDRRVRGCLVGSGIRWEECQRLIRELGAEEVVRLVGQVKHEDVPDYLELFDCAVAPMEEEWLRQMRCWHASTKVAEYLAAGLPVLAFDLPGSESAQTMREVSLAVRPGDVTGLARAIVSLTSDPQRKQRMSAAARKLGRERTWERTLERILAMVGPFKQNVSAQ